MLRTIVTNYCFQLMLQINDTNSCYQLIFQIFLFSNVQKFEISKI